MRHYLLMACRVGGPNLVTNSVGFEIYKSVLRKSTSLRYYYVTLMSILSKIVQYIEFVLYKSSRILYCIMVSLDKI